MCIVLAIIGLGEPEVDRVSQEWSSGAEGGWGAKGWLAWRWTIQVLSNRKLVRPVRSISAPRWELQGEVTA